MQVTVRSETRLYMPKIGDYLINHSWKCMYRNWDIPNVVPTADLQMLGLSELSISASLGTALELPQNL